MINVNDFKALTDSETIENAIKNKDEDGIVVIPPRKSDIEPERDWWLIDRAILIPENTTIIVRNSTIKLSDICRDNFFRTANCGMGIEYPERISNVHLKGEGNAVLQGADHPRATGDSSKFLTNPAPYELMDFARHGYWLPESKRKNPGTLTFDDKHYHSFGTDAGKKDESQYGDWRGIGVLFANCENFTIENITIVESHGWGISMEACAYGTVSKIHFDARMSKYIDGMAQNIENEDGIDVRNGCHNITITDVTGCTGDDLIALTAISGDLKSPGGQLYSTHVMHSDWTKREKDIHDIIIRNVAGYSHLCYMIRLTPAGTKIYNVIIDGVIDNCPDYVPQNAVLLLGGGGGYGVDAGYGLENIVVTNVISKSKKTIELGGFMKDSVISNVVCRNPIAPPVVVYRKNGVCNVKFDNIVTGNENEVIYLEQE